MKNNVLNTLIVVGLFSFVSCSQDSTADKKETTEEPTAVSTVEVEPHSYGGWYCPDNLNGFPAVDIQDWESIPVVNGRMPTKEETGNGTSLIQVNMEKYPNAKPLDMKMPKLAHFFNQYSNKEEIIIVIQAVNISNDSIVGFRYLNGGNGSARLNEIEIISNEEAKNMTSARFISQSIKINATQAEIWEYITKEEYTKDLQPIFDPENKLKKGWNKAAKINYSYANAGKLTAEFAGDQWGCLYAQIDFESNDTQYVQKILLIENEETKNTEMKITFGPYGADYETQKIMIKKWAKKVKALSEKK